jgi:glycerol-3-phosphate dehydrogenase
MVDVPTLTAALKARTGLPDAQVKRLVDLYGSRAFHVWQLAEQDPKLRTVIHPSGVMAAELIFAVDTDLARSLTDVFARRVLLAFEPGHALESVDEAAALLAEHLGWDDDAVTAQIGDYQRWLDKLAVPDPSGPRSESFGAGVPAPAAASR